MIAALALAALARAVDVGELDAAYAALGRADPLLRAAARKRVRAAHADALLATHDKHADDGRHALRLAYLILARARPAGAACDDVAEVIRLHDAACARRPGGVGFWWATALVLLAVGVAVGGAAIAVARIDSPLPPLPAATLRSGPAPRGAFATGGVPAPLPGDAAFRRALGADAPAYLIALDRWSDARRSGAPPADLAAMEKEMADARARALSAEAAGALGEGVTRALDALLTAARAVEELPAAEPGDPADEAFEVATAALDDEIAATGAGYFVDGDSIHDSASGRRLSVVYAFAVERVSLFTAGDATVPALHVRRIDHLNWTHTLLGFTRPHLRSAVVLLDQLDEHVLTLIAPGLAKGAPVRLFDADADVPERAAVEARAGELGRAEYGALPGIDAVAAARLGELLGRRRGILEALEKRATERGMALVVPGALRLPEGFARSLAGFAGKAEIAELGAIDEALGGDEHQRTFGALREALAASVERHEVQHRLDARAPRVMPKELSERVGPLEKDGKERSHAAAARAELSAYLSELARDDRTGRFGLGMVARFLFDKHLHGSAECNAAVVIVEGLAAELALPPEAPLVAGHAVDRRVASKLYLALTALPPERLRGAAKHLWERLFAAPLPELRRKDPPP